MSEPAAFYDTCALPRVEREAAQVNAKGQEQRALDWFRAHPWRWFSRDELEAALHITTQSGSRVLANLTARGLIEKSAEANARGKHKARVHTWRLARPVEVGQTRSLFA